MIEGFRVPPGPSIIERIWAELDKQTCKMMEIVLHQGDFANEEMQELGEAAQRGHCLGLAKALSILLNPYDPDINEVRREAMRRYRTRGSNE